MFQDVNHKKMYVPNDKKRKMKNRVKCENYD